MPRLRYAELLLRRSRPQRVLAKSGLKPGQPVAGFGVVGDLCAVVHRAITRADNRAVMHEQVRGLVIGRDEAKPLRVAEPLHGSGSHRTPPASNVLRTRSLRSKGYAAGTKMSDNHPTCSCQRSTLRHRHLDGPSALSNGRRRTVGGAELDARQWVPPSDTCSEPVGSSGILSSGLL